MCSGTADNRPGVQRREGRARRRHLSLSTNNIEKITNLAGLDSLQVLSLGRNQIKKLENLDPLAETLLELWVSYNLLERLARPLRARCIY